MIVNHDPVVVNVVQIPFADGASAMVAVGMKMVRMVVTFAMMVPAVMAMMMSVSQGWCGRQTCA